MSERWHSLPHYQQQRSVFPCASVSPSLYQHHVDACDGQSLVRDAHGSPGTAEAGFPEPKRPANQKQGL